MALKKRKDLEPFIIEVEGMKVTCRRFDPKDNMQIKFGGGSYRNICDVILNCITNVETEEKFDDGTPVNPQTLRQFGDQAILESIVTQYLVKLNSLKPQEAEEKKDGPTASEGSSNASAIN